MTWGDPQTTMRRSLSNAISPWGAGGAPTQVPIARAGILRYLRMITTATMAAFTGAPVPTKDVLGPWNQYSQVVVLPNQGSPIVRMSGVGAEIMDIMKRVEEHSYTPDTVPVAETNADPSTNVFQFPASGTPAYRNYFNLYMSQMIASVGVELGLWPLENAAVQLELDYTPSSASGTAPFDLSAPTAGLRPYLQSAAQGTAPTNGTPSVNIVRELWQVPASQEDEPPYTYVVSCLEESPQGANVNGASQITWNATPLSGILLRLGMLIFDGSTGNGVAESSLLNSNSLNLLMDTDTNKYAETGAAAHERMHQFYGFALPQGVFCYDFLGNHLTLTDAINTYNVPNIRFQVNLSTPLGATNSFAKFIRQTLVPIQLG